MRWTKISKAVIRRLPVYLRILDEVAEDTQLISSQELADRAGVGSALVRKDLAWFGEFGKQGVGYQVEFLRSELRKILNLNREIPMGLIGAGSLGEAVTRYSLRRYEEDSSFSVKLVALFDNDPEKIGGSIENIPIFSLDELAAKTKELNLELAMIAVPAEYAQEVANKVIKAGIKGILNFAPVKLQVPEDIQVANADVSLELQFLAYYLK
ncbi:MAG: redox-sensing transcriptional repressor Rex [Bacillota bacterium]|jgi:redox-sensing transcriptional repressor|nr:redox-sensing transcriptional repressor Rex [Bacillota bacterium]